MNNDLNCIHFGPCAGCVFDRQLNRFPLIEEAKTHYHSHGIEAPIHFFGAHEWRTRAKLAVRGTCDNPAIGLFERHSHNVLDIPQCRVHHPSINQAVAIIRSWIKQHQITPYEEINRTGVLRYIQCTVERSTGKIQLALVCNEMISRKTLEKLWESAPFWHSIWLNFNQRSDNVIFGEQWSLEFGEEWLWERLAGVDCCFHPAGFIQANLTAYDALLVRIGELIPPGKKIVEYYAGAGSIGLSLAARGCRVSCFESNSACEASFLLSKQRLTGADICWKHAATDQVLDQIQECDVVIVDPPRKGLDNKTLKALADAKVGVELVYVSCGWDSCKKNLDFLLAHGWQIRVAEIYLFFPGSSHIETLQVLSKINSVY